MEITKDILLRGEIWSKTIDRLSPFFKSRPHYEIFMLALSIGIMYDINIEPQDIDLDLVKSVPRNVIHNNDNGRLDFFFQAAILSTRTVDFSEEQRLELAFGEKKFEGFNKIDFLVGFANKGVQELFNQTTDDTLETMGKLKNFLFSTLNGSNYDLLGLDDGFTELADMDL